MTTALVVLLVGAKKLSTSAISAMIIITPVAALVADKENISGRL
jgi:hypothetical protein